MKHIFERSKAIVILVIVDCRFLTTRGQDLYDMLFNPYTPPKKDYPFTPYSYKNGDIFKVAAPYKWTNYLAVINPQR